MICVSLAGLSFEECIKAAGKSEYVEVRIDKLNLSNDQFKSLFSIKQKIIATCRPNAQLDDKQRFLLLKLAIDAGAGYIDLEYESEPGFRQQLTDYAHDHNVLVIISYHNFENTPEPGELESIIIQSKKWHADRVKITTMAVNKSDPSTIMALYARHENLIAFCMGTAGKITRVAAPLLGAEFTYAAWNNQLATAPGQLTVEELTDIYEILN